MVIVGFSINGIDGYFINGYCWLLSQPYFGQVWG
jgi:hypothetical protein